jgi:hypothetical protein
MATHVLNDAMVVINSVDLSDHVRSVEFTVSADEQDNTAMGNDGYSSTLTGLKTGTVTLEMNQDYAASSVYATLAPLFGSSFPVAIRPTSGAISSTNPEWQGTGSLFEFSFISGSVGNTNTTPVNIKIQGAITTDVTP